MNLIKNITLWNSFFYLYCLLPILLISGPFLPDLIISIISLVFLFYIFKNTNISALFKDKFIIFLLIFYVWINLSSLFSETILISMKSSFFYIRFIIFIIAGYILFEKIENFSQKYFLFILCGCIILFLDANIQYIVGKNILGFESQIRTARVSSLFGDEAILGSYLSKIFPIFLCVYLQIKRKINIYFLSIISFIFFFTIFIAGERAAIFHSLIFLLVFFTISTFNKKKIIVTIILSIIILSVLSVSIIDKDKNHRVFKSVYYQFKHGYVISKYHEEHFKSAYIMFKDSPIIGHGVKSFRNKCKDFKVGKNSCSTHPHNTYLQLLAETGLVGFILIFGFFLYISFLILKCFYLKYFKSIIFLENDKIAILVGLFTYLFPVSSNGNFFNNWLSILFFLQVSLFYIKFKNEKFF